MSEIVEETNRVLEQAVNLPGAVAAVFLISLLFPILKIFPSQVTNTVLIGFAIPALYVFIINVIFNRDVKIGFHILLVFILTYGLYMFSNWPFDIHQMFAYSFFYIFGISFSIIGYLFYYILFRIGRRYTRTSYRMRFFLSFLPTVIVMIFIGLVFSILFGDWISTFQAVIAV